MGNSQKFNPFVCSELQDSLNRLSSVYSEYLQTVFSPEVLTAQIQQLQEEIISKVIIVTCVSTKAVPKLLICLRR